MRVYERVGFHFIDLSVQRVTDYTKPNAVRAWKDKHLWRKLCKNGAMMTSLFVWDTTNVVTMDETQSWAQILFRGGSFLQLVSPNLFFKLSSKILCDLKLWDGCDKTASGSECGEIRPLCHILGQNSQCSSFCGLWDSVDLNYLYNSLFSLHIDFLYY